MGIRRIFTDRSANGASDKMIIEVLNADGTVKTFKVQAQQLEGKSESEINAIMDSWLAGNCYEDFIGTIGVHVNRDGSLLVWTGRVPNVFPEDEPIP